jgi:hypothetical protein
MVSDGSGLVAGQLLATDSPGKLLLIRLESSDYANSDTAVLQRCTG